MAKEGNAYIEIKPDLSGFKEELKAALDKINVTLKVTLKPDIQTFKQDLREALAKVRAKAGVNLAPDTRGFTTEVKAALKKLKQPVFKVKIEPDTTGRNTEMLTRKATASAAALGQAVRGVTESEAKKTGQSVLRIRQQSLSAEEKLAKRNAQMITDIAGRTARIAGREALKAYNDVSRAAKLSAASVERQAQAALKAMERAAAREVKIAEAKAAKVARLNYVVAAAIGRQTQKLARDAERAAAREAKLLDHTTAQIARKLGLDFGKSGQVAGLRWVAGVEREIKRLGLVMGKAGQDAEGHFIKAFDPARGMEIKFRHAAKAITRTTSQLARDLGLQFERGGELAGLRWVSKVEGEVKKFGLSIVHAGKDVAGNFIQALDPVSGISTVFREADGIVKKSTDSMKFSFKKLGSVVKGLFSRAALIGTLIFLVGSLAGSIIQVINNLVGAALGLASALGQATLGGAIGLLGVMLALGQAMVVVKFAAGDLTEAIKIQSKILDDQAAGVKVSQADWDELRRAMKRLSPTAQQFVKAWGKVSLAIDEVKKKVQGRLFAGLDKQLTNTAKLLLPVVQKGLLDTAGALNQAGKGFAEWLRKGETTGLIATVMHNNSVAVGKLASACVPLLDVVLRLWKAFDPLIQLVADSVLAWLNSADATVKAKEKTGALADTVDHLRSSLKKVAKIVSNVFKAISSTLGAATGSGDSILDMLTRVTQKWSDWASSKEGQAAIKRFTDEAIPALREIGGLLADIFHWWEEMAKTGKAKELLDDIKAILKPLGEIIQQLSGSTTGTDTLQAIASILQTISDSGAAARAAQFVALVDRLVKGLSSLGSIKPFGFPITGGGLEQILWVVGKVYGAYQGLRKFGYNTGKWLKEHWDKLLNDLKATVQGVLGWIDTSYHNLLDRIGKLNLPMGALNQMLWAAGQIVDGFNGLKGFIEQWGPQFRDAWNAQWTQFMDNLHASAAQVFLWVSDLGQKIRAGWDQIWKSLKSSQALTDMVTAVRDTGSKMVTAIGQGLRDMASVVTSRLQIIKTLVAAAFSFILGSASTFPRELIKSLGPVSFLFSGVGEAIVVGIWDGIAGKAGWLVDKIKGFVSDNIKTPFLKETKSHSPSKWMRDEIGKPIGQGVAWGMDLTRNLVKDAALSLSLAAAPPLPVLAAAGAGAGASDVAATTAASPGAQSMPTIRVYIGERELTDIVRVTVDGRNEDMARALLSGRRI
jgi:hypothetical protein